MNVTWSDLRKASEVKHNSYCTYGSKRYATFVNAFLYDYYFEMLIQFKKAFVCLDHDGIGFIFAALLNFVFGPIYILSRWFNVLLPLVIFIYLWKNGDIIIFTDIEMFQVIMWIVYTLMLIVWFILGVSVLRDEFILWRILPSSSRSAAGPREQNELVLGWIKQEYLAMVTYPIVEKFLINHYAGV